MRALQLIGRWEGGAGGFGKRGWEGAHGLGGWAADVVGDYVGGRKGGDLEVEGGKAGEVLDGDDEAAELGLDGDEAVGAQGGLLGA